MKRFAAILLLSLLVFNWIGFRLILSLQENWSGHQLENLLDENQIGDAQLLCLRIPLNNLAYYTNSKLFDRLEGQVEINGLIYKLVKRRVVDNTMEVYCIADPSSMRIKSAKEEFFKIVNDLQTTAKGSKNASPKSPNKSYSSDTFTYQHFLYSNTGRNCTSTTFSFIAKGTCAGWVTKTKQPPEILG